MKKALGSRAWAGHGNPCKREQPRIRNSYIVINEVINSTQHREKANSSIHQTEASHTKLCCRTLAKSLLLNCLKLLSVWSEQLIYWPFQALNFDGLAALVMNASTTGAALHYYISSTNSVGLEHSTPPWQLPVDTSLHAPAQKDICIVNVWFRLTPLAQRSFLPDGPRFHGRAHENRHHMKLPHAHMKPHLEALNPRHKAFRPCPCPHW